MTTNETTPRPSNNQIFKVEFAGFICTAYYNSQYDMLHLSNGHAAYWCFVDTPHDPTKIIELVK